MVMFLLGASTSKISDWYFGSLDHTNTSKSVPTLLQTGERVFFSGIIDQSQKKALQLLLFGSSGKQQFVLNHSVAFHLAIYLSLCLIIVQPHCISYSCCLHGTSFLSFYFQPICIFKSKGYLLCIFGSFIFNSI